ncbi:trafficking protein Mon1-domain-containing protein [Scheffersomyces coipomensis]|uniref:trafficking protein Mon1-domain-containing protein n=1 Tax=Scheffersomyces coipomensis TaxID=1788519 RepID=UPI00315D1E38
MSSQGNDTSSANAPPHDDRESIPRLLITPPSLTPTSILPPSISQPTLAVNLENVSNGIIKAIDYSNSTPDQLLSSGPKLSVVSSESSEYGVRSPISQEEYENLTDHFTDEYDDNDNTEDNEELQNLISDIIRYEHSHSINLDHNNKLMSESSYLDFNIFPNHDSITDELEYYNKYIKLSKTNNEEEFHDKLKHFFIFSMAGKPIYSFNGADELVMGYAGILTTIISTFEENINEEIKSITVGDNLKIVAINRNPLVLVSISSISYELMSFSKNDVGLEIPDDTEQEIKDTDNDHTLRNNQDLILINQLNTLYNYLLSILSKPVIEKNFMNRMNYDLRRILTSLDFDNIDALCMRLSYGLPITEEIENNLLDTSSFDFFISELLDSSIQSIKITNTTRTRLNKILLASKKLKVKQQQISSTETGSTAGTISSYFPSVGGSTLVEEKFLGDDLLFSLLATSHNNKILSYMKPKNHSLSNDDLKLLLNVIHSSQNSLDYTEDLWIPLCLPNFNPNGFLYVFVKQINLSDYFKSGIVVQPLTIILISSNKNSFYQMQEISNYIIYMIIKDEAVLNTLAQELINSSRLSIIKDINVPSIKHFIYKSKKCNQFIMNDLIHFNNDRSMNSLLQLVYFYSVLHNTKAVKIKSRLKSTYNQSTSSNNQTSSSSSFQNKKLTYAKWTLQDNSVTGFMLADNEYEFYCLSNSSIKSNDLINHSLKIIKWCEKNQKRLFFGSGVVF